MSIGISFESEKVGYIGLEIEFGLFQNGLPVSKSQEFLSHNLEYDWTNELPAWQVECRTSPRKTNQEIRKELRGIKQEGKRIATGLNLELVACEVAPDMDSVYEISPKPRYNHITSNLPEKKWKAGCRVAGTHIHYGCKNLEHAFEVYNRLATRVHGLYKLGEHRHQDRPSRLSFYEKMASDWEPPVFATIDDWKQDAEEKGYADNLRDCWYMVRIHPYGTVEVRAFGVTLSIAEVISWVDKVREIAENT